MTFYTEAKQWCKGIIPYTRHIPGFMIRKLCYSPFKSIAMLSICLLICIGGIYLLSYLGDFWVYLLMTVCVIVGIMMPMLKRSLGDEFSKYLYNLANNGHPRAKELYKVAADLGHYGSMNKLSLLYDAKGKLEKVISIYEWNATYLCDNSLNHLVNLYAKGKLSAERAIKICKNFKGSKISSRINNTGDFYLGVIYSFPNYQCHNIAKSDKYFDRVSKLEPKYGVGCGDMYVRHKNFSKAEEMYKRSIQLGSIKGCEKLLKLYNSPLNTHQNIVKHIQFCSNIIKAFSNNAACADIVTLASDTLKTLLKNDGDCETSAF